MICFAVLLTVVNVLAFIGEWPVAGRRNRSWFGPPSQAPASAGVLIQHGVHHDDRFEITTQHFPGEILLVYPRNAALRSAPNRARNLPRCGTERTAAGAREDPARLRLRRLG